MSQIKNGRLGLYGGEHLKCNRMMTLGFKGLRYRVISIYASTTSHSVSLWPHDLEL